MVAAMGGGSEVKLTQGSLMDLGVGACLHSRRHDTSVTPVGRRSATDRLEALSAGRDAAFVGSQLRFSKCVVICCTGVGTQ